MLLVLTGATGTGKTGLSLDVADAIRSAGASAEIVNADAMQLYRGMDVGTAKLPVAERRGIPHHLFDLWEVTETASVAVYREAARSTIAAIEARGAVPILVGGSGLYVESVVRELDFPATDAALRAELEAEAEASGADALWRRLAAVDPEAAGRIVAANVRKVVRALEVVTLTGRPFAASLPEAAPFWRPTRTVRVEVANEPLAARLALRAERMWREEGLLDEVRGLLDRGLADGQTASRAVGYAQAIAVLRGERTVEDGIAETARLTWRLVRRQRAWFGRDRDAVVVDGLADDAAERAVRALTAGPERLP
ncbi:tRNA (adenosine(37)-N6)-dimethylallyltransferase MiaA [Amnibacterium kyonggiense]|uniref:tRNA dimethylallyltransferase n=1 Tax=Amnibacterium kyonggiense TaxID=595671 RepID=A0A4R7FG51_9MICO|nr:tRNA (adenosine(37)-N6)-dimethylallyltransferase MiaA [Amnibacterium kyonggiense]TDS75605.1 tRNA dimethylallyltransferase [Amnibacterium kyonggiense]